MKWKYIVAAIVACLLWGSAFAGAKIGFQYMPPIRLSGVRFIMAGVLLWPLLFKQKVDLRAQFKHWKFMLLFAFLQTFMQYGLFFMGLNKVSGATAAIIVGAGPLVTAILAHYTMHNDRMTLRKVLAISLGLIGVAFIAVTKGSILGGGSSFYIGIGFLLISNIIGGTTNIFVAKYTGKVSPIFLTSFANFTGGLALLAVGLFVEKPLENGFPVSFYAALTWLSIISAAGFSIWYTLLQKPGVKVSELNMLKFIIPVAGCILSWLILPDEFPDWVSVSGILIITLSLYLYRKKETH